jgi:hypothetical protein
MTVAAFVQQPVSALPSYITPIGLCSFLLYNNSQSLIFPINQQQQISAPNYNKTANSLCSS